MPCPAATYPRKGVRVENNGKANADFPAAMPEAPGPLVLTPPDNISP
jgi:hypothetical protein